MKKIIVIGGATAVGKTEISLKIAKRYGLEIINADASQFKKGLNIGTAKISKDEMDGIKHHLIDIIEPNDDFSISDFQKLARFTIDRIIEDGKIPLLTGGSGLYIDAVINDYKFDTTKSNHIQTETEYESYSNEELYEYLKSLDESLASLTHPNNRQRVLRYIERAKEGNTISKSMPLYDCLYLFFTRDRSILYKRINERVYKMLENGWIEECKELKNSGIDLQKIKEIGYKEIDDFLNGKVSYEELVDLIQKETRHYAKRQITWFSNKTNHIVVDLDNFDEEKLYKIIDSYIREESK